MRAPVVSRTFYGVDVKGLVLNLQTKEQYEKTVFMERLPLRKVDEFIRQRFQSTLTEHEKFVVALEVAKKARRFYMTEPEFVNSAHETELLKTAREIEEAEGDAEDENY